MNKVELTGRLTRDPEVRHSAGEYASAVARYTLAVKRRYSRTGEADADFVGCVAFKKQAEITEKYLKKGSHIAITGRMQTGRYENDDGTSHYFSQVVVEDMEFLDAKSGGSHAEQPEPMPRDGDGYMISEEDLEGLPFR